MKHILVFDLPDESNELKLCNNAQNYYSALFEFKSYLRARQKYSDLSQEELKYIEHMEQRFYEILDFCNVNMDEIE